MSFRKRPPNYLITGAQTLTQAQRDGIRRLQGYRCYSDNTGSVASSGTATVNTVFQYACKIYGVSCATRLSASATAAIGGLDGFEIAFSRQTGDTLNTEATIGSALFDRETGMWWLGQEWEFMAGEAIQSAWTNLQGASALYAYVDFHVIEIQGAV